MDKIKHFSKLLLGTNVLAVMVLYFFQIMAAEAAEAAECLLMAALLSRSWLPALARFLPLKSGTHTILRTPLYLKRSFACRHSPGCSRLVSLQDYSPVFSPH